MNESSHNQELRLEFAALKSDILAALTPEARKTYSYLQNYLFFFAYPLFSFGEAVIILCDSGKVHIAEVLLRTMFEAHINIIYHQLGDTNKKLALSAKNGFDSKVKGTKEIEELIKKYPNLESQDPTKLFSKKWLANAREWSEEYRDNIIKNNGIEHGERDLDLKAKAIKCDEAMLEGLERGHFERMYHVIYRQLSPIAHLNIEGIQAFVNEDEMHQYTFDDGSNPDFYACEAMEICTAFAKDLYDLKLIEGDRSPHIARMDQLLGNQARD